MICADLLYSVDFKQEECRGLVPSSLVMFDLRSLSARGRVTRPWSTNRHTQQNWPQRAPPAVEMTGLMESMEDRTMKLSACSVISSTTVTKQFQRSASSTSSRVSFGKVTSCPFAI